METLKSANNRMKILILATAISAISVNGFSQNPGLKQFKDCTGIKTYFAQAGDTVVFHCDNIRLYNQASFNYIKANYENLYANSHALQLNSDSTNSIYKSLYENKSLDYEQLKESYSQFRIATHLHLLSTDSQLTLIQANSRQAQVQLQNADSAIASGIKKIETYRRNQWKTKVSYFGWGFIGGLASALLLALAI